MPDPSSLSQAELLDLIVKLYGLIADLQEQAAVSSVVHADEIARYGQQIAELKAEIERLRSNPPGGGANKAVPDFVKPTRAARPAKLRKKRPHSFVRHKDQPTKLAVEHAADCCPDCGRKLCGGSVHRTRQVIDIPATPVEVVDHVILGRWCGVCNKRVLPKVDLSDQVVGKHRIGVGIMSLVGYLHEVGRMPLAKIKEMLSSVYKLSISEGEIVHILHTLASRGKALYNTLRDRIWASDFVHGDETSWREDGVNGYLWCLCTPDTRYFLRRQSRGSKVVVEMLGENYQGVLVTDFYAAYNVHMGLHQRCWVHFLRDLRKLKEEHPFDGVPDWIDHVVAIYRQAKEFESEDRKVRARKRVEFQNALVALARQPARESVPHRVLAKRILRFEAELFTFVEYPYVPSENNAAERAVRPSVIARKISGGTRSEEGSNTKAVLQSLFGTWQIRHQDPILSCRQMLTGQLLADGSLAA